MVVSCAAYGCTNRWTPGGNLQFFGFPLRNPALLAQWVSALKRKNFTPTKHSRLCSVHFVETDYLVRPNINIPRLKEDAVPSVFPGFPSYYQPKAKKMRTLPKKVKRLDIPGPSQEDLQSPHEVSAAIEIPTFEQSDALVSLELCPKAPGIEKEIQTVETCLPHSIRLLKKKVKVLNQKIRRQKQKINTLEDLVREMKKNGLIDDQASHILTEQFSGTALEIFQNQIKNKNRLKHGVRYSEELKKFALTLHYYSSRAYNFCRSILTLPHPSSIKEWTSSVNAEPGFFKEVLDAIRTFPRQDKDCTLILDGMSLKVQLVYHPQKGEYVGYCDYGKYVNTEGSETLAREALVFMLVSLNGKWKWPIGYFFHHNTSGTVQAELIRTALHLCQSSGIRVWAVTCDGSSVNFSAMHTLGCKAFVPLDKLQNSFPTEKEDARVHWIPDGVHMLKLARNSLATSGTIYHEGNPIKWDYIVQLHNYQDSMQLKFANKLTKAHVYYENNKMKVKLAGQTLSSSVAAALEFLMEQGVPEFQGCAETIKFIRVVDRIFDFLNTRSPHGKGFKKPLYFDNIQYLEETVWPLIKYLYELEDKNGKPFYKGDKKKFIVGFAVGVRSVLDISKKLLSSEGPFKYLLTYKFSQDHLELLFSKIRSRQGFNNNPNVIQFAAAMRSIVMKNSITSSPTANSIALEDDPAVSLFEIKWRRKERKKQEEVGISDDNVLSIEINSGDEAVDFNALELTSKDLVEDVASYGSFDTDDENSQQILYYIAGFVVRSVVNKIDCASCKLELALNAYARDHDYASISQKFAKFFSLRNKGGLVAASESVYVTVQYTEKCLRRMTLNFESLNIPKLSHKVVLLVVKGLSFNDIFCNLNCDSEAGVSHKLELIKLVSSYYVKIRCFAISKLKAESAKAKSMRHRRLKMTLLGNE